MEPQSPYQQSVNLEPGSVVANRYEVVERVGSGGVGLVFKVIDRELNDQVVALKVLHPHLARDEGLFKRFRNELLVARTLTHPNIVRLHDIGRAEGGFYYITMEFVDGFSLKDRIARGKGLPCPELSPQILERVPQTPLTFFESAKILYQILNAVGYAHGKGVVHRDLKPANVLISSAGEVKLADFGTARITGMDTSLTQTGQLIGTPDYMSPEQIKAEKLDELCDIYALGILGYEIVTGERPFAADTAVAVAFKHLSEPIPDFATPSGSAVVAEDRAVPGWYQELIRTAAAKDKSARFCSAAEFAERLADHLPDIVRGSGFFPADSGRSVSVTATQLGAVSPKSAVGAAPVRVRADDNQQGAQYRLGEDRFGEDRLGEVGAAAGSAERWHLGDIGSAVASGDFVARPQGRPTGVAGGDWVRSVWALLVVVMLLVVIRFVPAVNTRASESLLALGVSQSVASSLLGERVVTEQIDFAEQTDLTKQIDLTKGAPVQAQDLTVAAPEIADRLQLEQELLGADRGSGNNSSATGDVPVSAMEGSKEGAAEAPKVNPEVSIESPGTAALPPDPVKSPLSLKLSLIRAGGEKEAKELGETVSNLELSKAVWSVAVVDGGWGEFKGLDKKIQRAVADRVSLSMFDLSQSAVLRKIAAQPIDVVGARTSGKRAVQLGGRFGPEVVEGLKPGRYRFDLLLDGEVLGSSAHTLYAVAERTGADRNVVAGGGNVAVRENVVSVSGKAGEAVSANNTSVAGASAIAVASGVNEAAVVAPQVAVASTTSVPPVVTDSGLPPAQGMPASRAAVVPQPHAVAAVVSEPSGSSVPNTLTASNSVTVPNPVTVSEPVVVTERYSGSFTAGSGGGSKPLRLDIQIAEGKRISGSATIEGLGQFVVQGELYPRGVTLTLANEEYGISFTGSRDPGRSMRGVYSFPSKQERGSWVVQGAH